LLLLGLAAFAAALAYCTAMPGSSFRGPAPSLDADGREIERGLTRIVTGLAVEIGERRASEGDSLSRALSFLESELAPLLTTPGVTLRREALTDVPNPAANLVLELPGTKPGPLVLIGAHYDSAPGGTPAANDNASGSAAAVVLAQRLARAPHALPLRFVLFANEEMPYFTTRSMGSSQHAAGCRRRGELLRAMLSLETMGYYSDAPGSQKYPSPLSSLYPDRGNFIAFVGNVTSRSLVRDVIGSFRTHATIASEGAALPDALPGVGWSDHWSFWQYGYSAAMVTDTAIYRDPNYHRLSDSIDKLDFERLARVVVGLQAAVLDLSR
jgi:Zn-dependent M28 family amino/carboxypeptidase